MEANVEQRSSSGVEKEITVIGFGLRLASTLLDAMMVGVMSMLVATFIGVMATLLDLYTARDVLINALTVGGAIIFSVAYYVVSWTKSGQTIAKAVLGIKVVGPDGKPPSVGKAILRYIGYFVNAIFLSLGFLWVVFDRKRQGWHDKMAGTYVVYSDDNFSDINSVKLVPSDPKPSWLWVVLWVILALGLPFGMVSVGLVMGPFIGKVLSEFLGR